MIRITSVQVGKPQTMPAGHVEPTNLATYHGPWDQGVQDNAVGDHRIEDHGVEDHRGRRDANEAPLTWTSAIVKKSVHTRLWLGKENLVGDAQADLKNHGGPDKAVLGYSLEHYNQWREELGRPMLPGSFGENFTITGMNEDSVCVGDRFRIGTAVVEVSQPRQPCWKLSRLWGIANLDELVRQTGRTGWYFRVLEEGDVGVGDELVPLTLRRNEWTVRAVSDIMNDKSAPPTRVKALLDYEYLAEGWRDTPSRRWIASGRGEG